MYLNISKTLFLVSSFSMFVSCVGNADMEEGFKSPSADYRPMPFWHVKGDVEKPEIMKQIAEADSAGFGGVTFLPIYGMTPEFLGDEYFSLYGDVLSDLEKRGMKAVLYDDISFPSGTAGGEMERKFPDYTRKRLDRTVYEVNGPRTFTSDVPSGVLMSAVAMNETSKERIDLSDYISDGKLKWQAPQGKWKVMFFNAVKDGTHKKYLVVDLLDSLSMSKFMTLTYDKYEDRFKKYLGNLINYSFFDDVGFFRAERTWTPAFNEKFEQLYGYSPVLLYPALWENIGPETESARVALFNTRAELLAEGFPKTVARWADKNGLKSTGHPPGNYNPMPVDMNADIFKFYRYTQMPLMDAIIGYGYGRDGHKLVSSAADYYDRPMVGAEIYGAIKDKIFDADMMFQIAMETMARGANFIVPHGMWYKDKVGIPPLISIHNQKLEGKLPEYSEYIGRMSYILRGGRRIADIALLYPIADLQGFFRFQAEENVRPGHWVSDYTNYTRISEMLTEDIHCDFTFVHPELLLTDKYSISDGKLKLMNTENYQDYEILIMPSQKVMSVETLSRVKDFYDAGGKIIAVGKLPSVSSENGRNSELLKLVSEVFGDMSRSSYKYGISVNDNFNNGKAVFLPELTFDGLNYALELTNTAKDVILGTLPDLNSSEGCLSYIHKNKEGRDFYFFANSTDKPIDTEVSLRGQMTLELWNPYTGEITPVSDVLYKEKNGQLYSCFNLKLDSIDSVVIVGK